MQQLHKNCQHDACLEERPKMESKPKIPTFSSKANTPPVMMQSSWIAFLDPVAIVQLTSNDFQTSDITSTKSNFW